MSTIVTNRFIMQKVGKITDIPVRHSGGRKSCFFRKTLKCLVKVKGAIKSLPWQTSWLQLGKIQYKCLQAVIVKSTAFTAKKILSCATDALISARWRSKSQELYILFVHRWVRYRPINGKGGLHCGKINIYLFGVTGPWSVLLHPKQPLVWCCKYKFQLNGLGGLWRMALHCLLQ